MTALSNPAASNSARKAPPSFAPAIQANQSAGPDGACGGGGSFRISSAA